MVAAATRLGTLAGAVPESRRGTTPRRAWESSTTDTTSTFRRTKFAEVLASAVQEDGSFLNPPSVCGIGVSPGYPGVPRGRGRFDLDADGSLVGGVHNSNPGQTTCVNGATTPVMTRKPPFKVPRFAIGPLRARVEDCAPYHEQFGCAQEDEQEEANDGAFSSHENRVAPETTFYSRPRGTRVCSLPRFDCVTCGCMF